MKAFIKIQGHKTEIEIDVPVGHLQVCLGRTGKNREIVRDRIKTDFSKVHNGYVQVRFEDEILEVI